MEKATGQRKSFDYVRAVALNWSSGESNVIRDDQRPAAADTRSSTPSPTDCYSRAEGPFTGHLVPRSPRG
ncbi:hypothetical protein, partial [Natrinema soli]